MVNGRVNHGKFGEDFVLILILGTILLVFLFPFIFFWGASLTWHGSGAIQDSGAWGHSWWCWRTMQCLEPLAHKTCALVFELCPWPKEPHRNVQGGKIWEREKARNS